MVPPKENPALSIKSKVVKIWSKMLCWYKYSYSRWRRKYFYREIKEMPQKFDSTPGANGFPVTLSKVQSIADEMSAKMK